jgi:simple sugar transport system substrate-binding protein
VSVECNPLLGPQFFELALKVVNGVPVAKEVPVIETIFDIHNAEEA